MVHNYKQMISKQEYLQRIRLTQAALKQNNIDTLIVSEEEDIYYLTGLTYKSLERLFILVIKEQEVTFILPKMELAHLKSVDNVTKIKTYWEYPAQEPECWRDVLLEEIRKSYAIGIGSKAPYEIASFIASVGLNVMESHIVERLRWIKSEAEISLIKRASSYCDVSISKINKNVYYGMTELEVFSVGRSIQQKVIKETSFDYLAHISHMEYQSCRTCW
jgi:Xaa-Pro aminopeptidase